MPFISPTTTLPFKFFLLDSDPKKSAEYMDDTLLLRCMSSYINFLDEYARDSITKHSISTKWLLQDKKNVAMLLIYLRSIVEEMEFRFGTNYEAKKKIEFITSKVQTAFFEDKENYFEVDLPPKEYWHVASWYKQTGDINVFNAYKESYYSRDILLFSHNTPIWTKRNIPGWWKELYEIAKTNTKKYIIAKQMNN